MTNPNSTFVHPEEIRCSTPTRINVAENCIIYTALDDGDFDLSSNDASFADYDTIFSAALDLHLMEIAVSPPTTDKNNINHYILTTPPLKKALSSLGNSVLSTPYRHHPMDPASHWTEEVRHAQSIIDENVADMLSNKLATQQSRRGETNGKKSFVVEFSSAKEYEQFLEFKNKLTASSCSSPECLVSSYTASPSNVLHNRNRQYEGEESEIVSMPTGENESYHTTTTPSTSSSLSSDSSSYLATLTEEDEEEDEEVLEPCGYRNVPFLNPEAIINGEELKDVGVPCEYPLNKLSSHSNGKRGEVGGPKVERNRACPDISPGDPKQTQIPVEARDEANPRSGVNFGNTNRQDVKHTETSSASSFSTDARICKDNSYISSAPESFPLGQVQELSNQVPFATSIVDCSTGIFPLTGPFAEQIPPTWLSENENQKSLNAQCSVFSRPCESGSCNSGRGCVFKDEVTLHSSNFLELHEVKDEKDNIQVSEKSNSEKETIFNCGRPFADRSSKTFATRTCPEEYCSRLHNVKSCSSSGGLLATVNNNNNGGCTEAQISSRNNNDDDSYDANGTFFSCCNSPLFTSEENCCVVSDGDKSATDNLNDSAAHTNGCLQLHISANIKVAVDQLNYFPQITSTSAQSDDVSICPASPAEIILTSDKNCIALTSVQESSNREFGLDFEDQPDLYEQGGDISELRTSSSTSSLNSSFSENSASFVASNRLKRLEERLKRFQYAKKLISDPNGTGEGNSICCPSITLRRNLLDVNESDDDEEQKLIRDITKRLQDNFDKSKFDSEAPLQAVKSGRSEETNKNNEHSLNELVATATTIIEELERVDRNNNIRDFDGANHRRFGDSQDLCDEAVTRFATPSPTSLDNNNTGPLLLEPKEFYSKCTFNTQELAKYSRSSLSLEECYDELVDEDLRLDVLSPPELNRDQEEYCDCVLEAYPLYYIEKSGEMRETTGPLRGLLKKPNRPQQERKNRVVFDETRNEFFDADYIILIREDCPYDEEDEEPCTCGEHELVRLCCEEGCQCPGFIEGDGKTPQSPKFAPPIEFVDQATLSPPEGYKDAAALSNALGGALGGHVFGAQHIQQLQVIQRLQQQRAAMLAARSSNQQPNNGGSGPPAVPSTPSVPAASASSPSSSTSQPLSYSQVCMECAECAECAKQDEDCQSPCPDELNGGMAVPHVAIVPIKATSSSQKEIIAGEERPKYFAVNKADTIQIHGTFSAASSRAKAQKVQPRTAIARPASDMPSAVLSTPIPVLVPAASSIIVETITMTTVTERRIVSGVTDNRINITAPQTQSIGEPSASDLGATPVSAATTDVDEEEAPALPPKESHARGLQNSEQQPTGILKGGKLWKTETGEDISNVTSDEEINGAKRSVRFEKLNQLEREDNCDGNESEALDGAEVRPMDILPIKKHTSLFHNALRPNSAVRQLFPTGPTILTQESLRAFEESKRLTVTATPQPTTATVSVGEGTDSDTDTIRKTIERNALRRSLIKYEPKKVAKQLSKSETSLEERIRLLTCDIDEPALGEDELERRNSPAGEENTQQSKYVPDKNYSPSSSASSSSSGSAYKKITDIFNKNQRQDKIPEGDENLPGVLPQDCRCPSAPDIGIGAQMPQTHTQIHQTPPRQGESRRQFLSTLAPLTACVAGQRDDMSYYTLSAPGDRQSTASSHCSEYSLGDIEAVLRDDGLAKKVAPDVIAGTPGQESDELAAFAQQDASRTERIKKRYSGEQPPQGTSNKMAHSAQVAASGVCSDEDDEHNDYGFNKRPSVRGIKPRFGTTNEILQQMQAQLAQPGPLITASGGAPSTPQVIQKVQTVVQQQQIATTPAAAVPGAAQHPGQWGYYPLGEQSHTLQRTQSTSGVPEVEFYGQLPAHMRHSFHGHHETATTLYQNCQGVAVNHQHHPAAYGHYARSPTRRPESPPPLRNYHQTMVLIPYNTETYAHYSANEHVPGHQIRRLEYQQVTQQTIRVPMGFPLPGMQLHMVTSAGRGSGTTTTTTNDMHSSNYGTLPRLRSLNGNYEFVERGAPEGAAASVQAIDHKSTIAMPPSAAGAIIPIQTGPPQPLQQPQSSQPQGQVVGGNSNNNNTNGPSTNVFYAMNV